MSKVVCEFCDSVVLKKTFKRHQETLKCLAAQSNSGNVVIYECECGKSFNKKSLLVDHTENCPVLLKIELIKVKKELIDKDLEIVVLTKLLGKQDGKPIQKPEPLSPSIIHTTTNKNKAVTNTQNNIINNNNIQIHILPPLNLSSDYIREQVDEYTVEHYLKGAEGMAEWMVERVLRDKDGKILYVCTDKNRKHFHYFNENKEKIEDIKAQRLLAAITPDLTEKLNEIMKEQNKEIVESNCDETDGQLTLNDAKIIQGQKKNSKLHQEALGPKMLNKLVEKIYT